MNGDKPRKLDSRHYSYFQIGFGSKNYVTGYKGKDGSFERFCGPKQGDKE